MSSYIATFKRVETKYLIDAQQRQALEAALCDHMEVDEYGKTLISSMYWDTARRDMIARSIEHPLYKEKVRLRRYGQHMTLDTEECFVELKTKYDGVVYKRRCRMSSLAASLLLQGHSYESSCLSFPLTRSQNGNCELSYRSRQVGAELEALCRRQDELVPSVLIECDRTAWRLLPNSPDAATQLRITFDEALTYRDLTDIKALNTLMLDQDASVLEIKAVGAMPRWLADALSANDIRPASFTKYGTAYKELCAMGKAA